MFVVPGSNDLKNTCEGNSVALNRVVTSKMDHDEVFVPKSCVQSQRTQLQKGHCIPEILPLKKESVIYYITQYMYNSVFLML